jgi:hypothetical protein
MATDASHAATQLDKSFAVEVLTGPETATVIAGGLSDFLDAFECAVEWLDREDPQRTGDVSIAILLTSGAGRELVWSFPPEGAEHPNRASRGLVEVFGFDPVTWSARLGEEDAAGRRLGPDPRQPQAAGSTSSVEADLRSPARTAVDASPSFPAFELAAPRETRRVGPGSRRLPEFRDHFRMVWDDRLSRLCLVVAAISLWLTVTLVEPSFLAPLLAAAAGLWSRRSRRAPLTGEGVDWF